MRRIQYVTVTSTNDEASRLLDRYPGEPFLVTATEQTAGRGRAGRSWCSPAGGAWMSLAWPMVRPAALYDAAPLIAALAVRGAVGDVLEAASGDRRDDQLRVKWPNDVLLAGRKVAGVLCERVLAAGGAGSAKPGGGSLIVGVGINADFDTDRLAGVSLRYPAVTLREVLGAPVDLERLIDAFQDRASTLLRIFDRDGLSGPVLGELRAVLAFAGCEVELAIDEQRVIRGWQRGLDESGRLLVETSAGTEACTIGDVRLLSVR